MMNNAFAGLTWQCCLVYLDDIIIFSKDFDQHLLDIVSIFQRIDQHGLRLKPAKCHICCTEVQYLGHILSERGIRADPAKIAIVKEWPIPRNVKEIQSFLGLCGYYRKLIKDFAKIEAPLRRVTRKGVPFIIGPIELQAFNKLKQTLISDPILVMPDFSGERPFVCITDACDTGVGAILAQHDENDQERVIAYASKMFNEQQIKWHTQEKEAYAIVWALEQFRPYLLGTKFQLKTDHQSLQWLNKSPRGRLARWAMALNEFNFDVTYRKGKSNGRGIKA
jgi:hypothetical protein